MSTNDAAARHAIPDWMLERYALGELPAAEMESVREALARDPRLAERLAELHRDADRLLAEHPAAQFRAGVRERLAATRRFSGIWQPAVLVAPALAAALVIGLWLGRQPTPLAAPPSGPAPAAAEAGTPSAAAPIPPSTDAAAPSATHPAPGATPAAAGPGTPSARERTRLKGAGPRLLLFRSVGGVVERLSPGSVARPGDVVQLAYQASGARYGAIVSVDGRGVVTSHVPRAGSTAAPLESGGPVALETAYRLDDAPAFEAFYFVTAPRPFDLGPLRAAARAAVSEGAAPPESLPLADSFDQTAFLLRKDASR